MAVACKRALVYTELMLGRLAPLILLMAQPPAPEPAYIDIFGDSPAGIAAAAQSGRLSGDALSRVVQLALDRHDRVRFPPGTYHIGQALTLRSGQRVRLSPGTIIRQDTPGRGAFSAIGANDVAIELNGGEVHGPGGWTREWRGNQGWDGYHGLACTGCERFTVTGPGRIVNWGHAAIAIIGGSGYTLTDVTMEGTHRFGTPLHAQDNFQNGIYIANDVRWGAADGGRITRPDISGTAQGIMREAIPGAPAPVKLTVIDRPDIHDIPGQHAIYNQDGAIRVVGGLYTRLTNSAVKFQGGDANRALTWLTATGIVARDIGGSMFEIAALGKSSINAARLQGTGTGVGYLISLNGRTRDLDADVKGSRITGHAAYVLGDDLRRVRLRVDGREIEQDGILVVATRAAIDISARIADPNGRRTPDDSGIRVYSPSAHVTLRAPVICDGRARMTHGIFNQRAGSTITLIGAVTATGAARTAIRADGEIRGLTKRAVLSGADGRMSGSFSRP